jgi:hypothetical protein
MRVLLCCVVSALALFACQPTEPCDERSCQGCCTNTGLCVTGQSLTNCGTGGALCSTCLPQQQCALGTCAALPVLTPSDAGGSDAGVTDGGSPDAGAPDAGASDAGPRDAGAPDAGPRDAGSPDAGSCGGAEVVIAQLYPTGGSSTSAPASKDWIELHNRGAQTVDLTGWALQYASATGTSWKVNALPAGTSIAAGASLVVVMGGSNAGGGALPTPNVSITGASDLAGSRAKVALTRTATALTGGCPMGGAVVDFLGYGTPSGTNLVDCFEGAAPAPVPPANGAVQRLGGGCTDTDRNGSDFVTIPTPAAAGMAITRCTCP